LNINISDGTLTRLFPLKIKSTNSSSDVSGQLIQKSITTLRDTTYTGIAVQPVVIVLFVGNSGARARVQTVRMRIIVPARGLKHVAMPVDSGDGKGAESQDNLIEKGKLHVGSVSRSTRDLCYESGSLSR
jgi:hypothetical protein